MWKNMKVEGFWAIGVTIIDIRSQASRNRSIRPRNRNIQDLRAPNLTTVAWRVAISDSNETGYMLISFMSNCFTY